MSGSVIAVKNVPINARSVGMNCTPLNIFVSRNQFAIPNFTPAL